MNLNEILEQLKQVDNKPNLSELVNVELSYIPFSDKRNITDSIANLSTFVDETTNLLIHDKLAEDLLTLIHKVLYLTDITIENILDEENDINTEVAIEAYDNLLQSGIASYIDSQLVNDDISILVEHKIKQKLETQNSVTFVLTNLITDIASKIPSQEEIQGLMTSLPAQLSQLNNLNILGNSDKPTPKTKSKTKSKVTEIKETAE